MTFSIDLATLADIAAMHVVRLAVRENRLNNPDLVTEQSYLHYVTDESVWVARREHRAILGFAALDWRAASVWALFVHPDAEGLGIGMALHDAMLESARRRGMDRLWLTTAPGTRAEHFYRRAGWTRIGASAAGEIRFERSLSSAQIGT